MCLSAVVRLNNVLRGWLTDAALDSTGVGDNGRQWESLPHLEDLWCGYKKARMRQ